MCTHLTKRNSRYYIRRKIPADLLVHYGRKEVVKALGTADPSEARRLCRIADVKLDEEFATVRAQLTASAAAPTPPPGLAQVDTIPAMTSGESAAYLRDMDAHERELLELDWAKEDEKADERAAAYALQKQMHREVLAEAGMLARPGTTAAAPTKATRTTSLEDVARKWQTERKPQQRTVDKAMRAIRRFKELVGDLPVEQVTKAHVIRFKDRFLASEQSPGVQQTPVNTDKYLEQLRIVLSYASKNAIIEHNPAKDVSTGDRRDAKAARLPFDLPALKAIFSGPVYTEGFRTAGGAGEAAYWLPLLGLFTGARLEELGQLRPQDVYEEVYFDDADAEQSVWVLRISGYGAGQEVKNEGSNRRFPVHPELVRLGFLKYVKQAAGRARLFDKLKPDPYGTETGNWSSWFSAHLRTKLGVADERMVFHSFRHKFKDATRAVGIAEDVSDAITGHSSGNVARRYGGLTYPLRPLVEAMNRYRIPGLVLPSAATS